jgi:hypothetical protein
MPRNVTTAMLTALSSGFLQPALFVSCAFANETVYVWSGIGSIVFGGHTYIGVGTLGAVSTIEETTGVTAKGIVISLSGLNPQALDDVLGSWQVGLPVFVYLGLFNGGALIDTAITSWAGRMDAPTITVGGDTCTISINAESRLVDMNSSVELRYTQEQNEIDHPGDQSFQYVNMIQNVPVFWGQYPVSSAPSVSGNR